VSSKVTRSFLDLCACVFLFYFNIFVCVRVCVFLCVCLYVCMCACVCVRVKNSSCHVCFGLRVRVWCLFALRLSDACVYVCVCVCLCE